MLFHWYWHISIVYIYFFQNCQCIAKCLRCHFGHLLCVGHHNNMHTTAYSSNRNGWIIIFIIIIFHLKLWINHIYLTQNPEKRAQRYRGIVLHFGKGFLYIWYPSRVLWSWWANEKHLWWNFIYVLRVGLEHIPRRDSTNDANYPHWFTEIAGACSIRGCSEHKRYIQTSKFYFIWFKMNFFQIGI